MVSPTEVKNRLSSLGLSGLIFGKRTTGFHSFILKLSNRLPEARQFDALKAARPATAAEVKAHAEAQAKADGKAFAG